MQQLEGRRILKGPDLCPATIQAIDFPLKEAENNLKAKHRAKVPTSSHRGFTISADKFLQQTQTDEILTTHMKIIP